VTIDGLQEALDLFHDMTAGCNVPVVVEHHDVPGIRPVLVLGAQLRTYPTNVTEVVLTVGND
jgi:hypothetical protein